MNALAPLAQAAGLILAGLGLGVTELWSLVTEQAVWRSQLAGLASVRPETGGAVEEIRGLWALSPREQANRTGSLKSKLSLFRFHPNFQAIFGATESAITWSEVVRERQVVLLDFRDIESPAVKKFCLLWIQLSGDLH